MGETIRVDIIDKKVLNVLKDLEELKLIRLRQDREIPLALTDWATKYKKAMTQQPLRETDQQLGSLRSAWE